MKSSAKDFLPKTVTADPGGLRPIVNKLNNERLVGDNYENGDDSDRGEGEPGVPLPDRHS
jgi:hypothetical protein